MNICYSIKSPKSQNKINFIYIHLTSRFLFQLARHLTIFLSRKCPCHLTLWISIIYKWIFIIFIMYNCLFLNFSFDLQSFAPQSFIHQSSDLNFIILIIDHLDLESKMIINQIQYYDTLEYITLCTLLIQSSWLHF